MRGRLVLSINNNWGTGKTTFIKMWQALLENNGFNILYFNAWEHDFDSNPLVAIMSELATLTKSKDASYNTLLQKAAVIGGKVIPSLLKVASKKLSPVSNKACYFSTHP